MDWAQVVLLVGTIILSALFLALTILR